MSTYESAYKSLLQGVSQQLPQERLPGQVSSQVNMVSDPVTNVRRRPGVSVQRAWDWTSSTADNTLAWFTDIAGARVSILLNTSTGNIRILNEAFAEEASLDAGAYLTTSDITKIRTTSVGNEFFLANLAVKPTLNNTSTAQNPANAGFFYIVAGAFSKLYTVTVKSAVGSHVVSYTTPSGTGAGDAALSTPEYIATQLYNALVALAIASLEVYIDGPYVFTRRTGGITVNSSVGTGFMITSKGGVVTSSGLLPARLPVQADNYIIRVGSSDTPQYFRYDLASTEWKETGAYGSPTGITNMPISIYFDGTLNVWALNTVQFEGRFAGDDTSNRAHEFTSTGITGMSTYQGRLILLSGPMVSASASNRPRRFYRSTVTSVLSSDSFEIGSSTNSSAAYEWAIPFQKDLLLFSRAYQAVIPSGNAAVTPATATVVPTSGHEVDTSCSPVTMGRTLMYSSPKSKDFFGILEMIPSNYTDSQYVSQDSTPHLPKYMAGRCRFAVSSGVASMGVFGPTEDRNALIVHEYHWDGDTKVQQAWHRWLFKYPVATAYFASDVIVVIFNLSGTVLMGVIDPRAGTVNELTDRPPFLDLNVDATIVDHVITPPSWMIPFINDLVAVVPSGATAGERIGTSVSGGTLVTVQSYPSGPVKLGIKYPSSIVPTPPVVTDYNGGVIHSGKATLLRFMVGTFNTSEFFVDINDEFGEYSDYVVPTLSWDRPEFQLGQALSGDSVISVIPCRTDLRTTELELHTDGTGELNITSLEYVAKANPKIKRK